MGRCLLPHAHGVESTAAVKGRTLQCSHCCSVKKPAQSCAKALEGVCDLDQEKLMLWDSLMVKQCSVNCLIL